ncbi:MAG: methyltransferase domain-containing protein, partial [Armatimonadetes bacterium]|nr:methyltransferase domain-containing protein [Armatimonadota bacterium]
AIGSQADRQRAFIGAMHVVSGAKAHDMARHAPPGAATRLLDIGGASGSFTIAYLQASAALRATLFDLPPVVELARQRLAENGLLERVELVAGDFYADDLPGGHDLALLSAIIHQNSREQNVALYRKVLEALLPGGRLLIRDHVLAPDRTSPRPGALFAVNMLCATPGGNSYTLAEISEDLTSAGFERVKLVHPDTQMDGIVEAWRP